MGHESPRRVESVRFNGIVYRRYPDAKRIADQRYYIAGIGDRQRGFTRLHTDIWRCFNGEVPDGYHVHHVDGDHDNNHPENLVAISEEEHQAHHAEERTESGAYRTPERLAHIAAIRPLAAAWHSSPEGLAWHSENGKRAWENRIEIAYTCEQCGDEYWTRSKSGSERFCSNKCKAKWRRQAGLDDEERTCERCGETFVCNRYAKMRFCSRRCSAAANAGAQAVASRRAWDKVAAVEVTCEQCGQVFQSRARGVEPARFCSETCRAKHAHHARPEQDRECAWCGETFRTKSKTARTCSRPCRAYLREADRRERLASGGQ